MQTSLYQINYRITKLFQCTIVLANLQRNMVTVFFLSYVFGQLNSKSKTDCEATNPSLLVKSSSNSLGLLKTCTTIIYI